VLLLVLAAVILVPAFSRANLDVIILQEESRERARLEALANSIATFEERHDRYPSSDDDWAEFDPRLIELCDAGTYAIEPRYAIRWDALGDPDMIVTMTPDRDFSSATAPPTLPWDRRRLGPSQNRSGGGRFLFMGDGRVQYRDKDWQARKDFAEWAGWSFKEEPPKE
jgi:hypothetical protein